MIFLILSILLYSINNYFWKKILSDTNIWFVIALRSLFTIILCLLLSCFIYSELLNTISWHQLKSILIASLLGALGLICMVSALKNGSLRQLGVFNLLTVFITVTYLIIFENLNIKYYLIGSFFILIGFAFYLFHSPSPSPLALFPIPGLFPQAQKYARLIAPRAGNNPFSQN
jgi:uncharacterized membrane protein